MKTSYKFYVESYTIQHLPMIGLDHNQAHCNKAYKSTLWYSNIANTPVRHKAIAYYKITSVNNTELLGCDNCYKLEEYLINPEYKKYLESFIAEAEAKGVRVAYIDPAGNIYKETF